MSMTPDERALAQKVHDAIADAGTTDIAVPMLARKIVRENPTEAAAVGADSTVRFVISLIERRLKPSNPNAPQLPGFALPERLPLRTEGGTVWRATVRFTKADYEAYDQLLTDGIKADQASQREYRREMRKVLAVLDKHGVACLADLPPQP